MIKSLNDDNFEELIDNRKISVIKLWHANCPMCVNLQPIYSKIAKIYEDDETFDFFEANVVTDENRLATKIRASSISDNPGGHGTSLKAPLQ
jgi:thioredoxin-like negative regulator of GroEL